MSLKHPPKMTAFDHTDAGSSLIDAIDQLLPQTQCGLCGYGACRPMRQP